MLRLANRFKVGIEALLILFLLTMVALTFADVLGRRLFGTPIYGAHDITEHLMAMTVFCGLPLLTSARGHLSVDLFDRYLMVDAMRWWHVVIRLVVAGLLALIGYQFVWAMLDAIDIREVSQELLIPRSYIYGFISLSCFVSALLAILPPMKPDADIEEAL